MICARWRLALPVALWLTACAQTPRTAPTSPTPPGTMRRAGRIGLQELADNGRAFSASFELQGSATEGELSLFTPLGGLWRRLRWNAQSAWMDDGTHPAQSFEHLTALTRAALATELPIAALFDWLDGRPTDAPGWTVDLGRHAEGRISAVRQSPEPAVQLRVVLDRD